MEEPKQPTASTDAHRPDRRVSSISNSSNYSRSNAPRASMAQLPPVTSVTTSGRQEPRRRPRKLALNNQGETSTTAKWVQDTISDLQDKLTERTQDLQAQKSRSRQLEREFGQIQLENNDLKKERDKLKDNNSYHIYYSDRYGYMVDRFILPYAQERSLQFDDSTGKTLDFVLSPLLQDAREAATLRNQVQVLQQELLTRGRKTSAISDEQFAQDFRKLAAQIKTLSRLLRPHEGMDIVEALGGSALANGVAPHHWSGRVGRKLFIESWIWSALIRAIFWSPFTVSGAESNTVFNLWSSMFGMQHCHGWPCPSLPCETWRCTTMEQLVTAKDHNLHLENNVMNTRADTTGLIMRGLTLVAPSIEPSSVCQIVDDAFTLAMHMSLQRSRLQLTFPEVGDSSSEQSMRILPTSPDDNTEEGIVASIINPGLAKWGDAHGKTFDHRYDIVPALVQLQAAIPENRGGIMMP